MSRQAKKVTLVNGRRVRVTRLDACGRLVFGDNNVAISNGMVTASIKSTTSTTNAVELKNANGEIIVNVPAKQKLTGKSVDITFLEVDPELFSIITGQAVTYDAFGNPDGITEDTAIDLDSQGVAIEIWSGAPAGDACEDEGAEGSFGYSLLPFLTGGVLGDYTIAEGGINFTLTGMASKDGVAWGVGPYNVQLAADQTPGPLTTALTKTQHHLLKLVSVAPPEATTGSRPQLDPEVTAITGITHTQGTGFAVSFGATPAPGSTVGVQWDFGDDSWDYVTGATVSHTYAAAGTYTVRASTNGTWVEQEITVS